MLEDQGLSPQRYSQNGFELSIMVIAIFLCSYLRLMRLKYFYSLQTASLELTNPSFIMKIVKHEMIFC